MPSVARARAAFYPSINLSALVGFASVSLSNLISAETLGYGAGPALTLPIFDGGRLRAQYRGAQAELGQAVASYDDTVLGAVHAGGRPAHADRLAGRPAAAAAQWLDAAQEAYRLDEERYRAGLASYLSVLDAQSDVFNARRSGVELQNQRASRAHHAADRAGWKFLRAARLGHAGSAGRGRSACGAGR